MLGSVMKAIVGKDQVVLRVFLAILAKGHILIEDIPGVGKTTLAIAFSKALNLSYSRVQFTPDVLASDITGFSVINKDTKQMEYTPGAILCNLFLADELNRATSRTQSALLEAMEEGQVTVDGTSHTIPQPFVVIATQNPVGAAGTQLLPDSQKDRFMLRLSLGYLKRQDEVSLLKRKQKRELIDLVDPVLTSGELRQMREEAGNVYVDPSLLEYIVTLVEKTRSHPDILVGASPRASIALTQMSKAAAYLQGRDYVIPSDIAPIYTDVLAHRLVLNSGIHDDRAASVKILESIFKMVKPPQIA